MHFKATNSPIQEGEAIEVQGMASEDECMREVFFEITWQEEELAVPLSQLIEVEEAIGGIVGL